MKLEAFTQFQQLLLKHYEEVDGSQMNGVLPLAHLAYRNQ